MTSIRHRLTWLLTAHLAAVVAAGGVLLWLWARHSVLAQFDATLQARAELIQATIEEDDGNLEIEFNLTKLPEFQREESRVEFQIRNRSGAPLITSAGFAALHAPESLWQGPEFASFRTPAQTPFRSVRTTFDAVDDRDGTYSGLTLLLAGNWQQPQSSLTRLALLAAACGLLGVAFLVLAVRRSLRQGLQPLEQFAARTGEIDLARLPCQVSHEEAPAELKPMVEKLNELLDRVHESLLRERRFTRDVAHELRTPVAELKSLAELAQRWEDQAGPEAFAGVGEIASEMESLVSALTLLNRLDAGSVTPIQAEDAPLPVLRHIAERHAAAAASAGHTMHLPEDAAQVVWKTDIVLWKIAASNLVENAIAYSPRGSDIRISLTGQALTVSNPAPDLTTTDIGRMTNAFWRKNDARSDQSHSGLGLSIVASIARTLGLEFQLTLQQGTLHSTLRRPRDPAEES